MPTTRRQWPTLDMCPLPCATLRAAAVRVLVQFADLSILQLGESRAAITLCCLPDRTDGLCCNHLTHPGAKTGDLSVRPSKQRLMIGVGFAPQRRWVFRIALRTH